VIADNQPQLDGVELTLQQLLGLLHNILWSPPPRERTDSRAANQDVPRTGTSYTWRANSPFAAGGLRWSLSSLGEEPDLSRIGLISEDEEEGIGDRIDHNV
jgi:hypothetical protein